MKWSDRAGKGRWRGREEIEQFEREGGGRGEAHIKAHLRATSFASVRFPT